MTPPLRELRLALGMRGGVSLTVWIGGACAELNELRVARRDADQRSFWTDVLATSNYTSVVVDVLAGASAGGLNAVLLATAIRYGASLGRMRELWLRLGGLDCLLRTEGPYLSLLDGDRTLLEALRSELRTMAPPGPEPLEHPEPSADHPPLDLQLSATLVEPVSARAFTPPDEGRPTAVA